MHKKFLASGNPCRAATRMVATLLFVFLSFHPATANESSDATDPSLASSHYTLVGIAELDGISYASLLNRQTGNHFLLSTDKKSELDVTLISVRAFDDASGPAAIIEKDNVSVLVKLESGITLASPSVTSFTAHFTLPFPAPNISQPGSSDVSRLRPPPGATLPLIFQEVDPTKMTLTDEQKATLKQLRQDFINAVNGTGGGGAIADASTPASSNSPSANANIPVASSQNATTADQQLQNWIRAQEHSDEMFRMLYGYQAFNAYTASSSYPTGP